MHGWRQHPYFSICTCDPSLQGIRVHLIVRGSIRDQDTDIVCAMGDLVHLEQSRPLGCRRRYGRKRCPFSGLVAEYICMDHVGFGVESEVMPQIQSTEGSGSKVVCNFSFRVGPRRNESFMRISLFRALMSPIAVKLKLSSALSRTGGGN